MAAISKPAAPGTTMHVTLLALVLLVALMAAPAVADPAAQANHNNNNNVDGVVDAAKAVRSDAWNLGRNLWKAVKDAFNPDKAAASDGASKSQSAAAGGASASASVEEEAEYKTLEAAYLPRFQEFKNKYNRQYATPQEEQLRLRAFIRNMEIAAEAQASNPEATFGMNALSDLTREELRQRMGMRHPNPHGGSLPVHPHIQPALDPAIAAAVNAQAAALKAQFEEFKVKFHRNYATPDEEAKRFEIFTANMAEIEKLRASNPEAQFGVNQFSDVSKEEMQKHKGLKVPTHQHAEAPKADATALKAQFEDFKVKFHRKYASPEEEAKRFEIFTANMAEVEKLRASNPEAQFGVNQFSDISKEEMNKRKGLKAPTTQKEPENQAAEEAKPAQQEEAPKDPKALFEEFKVKLNRKYATPEEEAKRYAIFVSNLEQMEKLRKTNPQAKFGLNQFSDMSREEMFRGKRD